MLRRFAAYLRATLRRWLGAASAGEVHQLRVLVMEHRALEHLRSRREALEIEGDIFHLQVISGELREAQAGFGARGVE